MKVRMLQSAPGAPDGLHVHQYEAGREYDEHSRPAMSDALADVFIRGGLAEEVKLTPTSADKAPEVQARAGAPEKQVAKRTKKAEN